MMATGKTVSYEQALDWGMINDLYEGSADEFREQIIDYAKQFCSPNKAPMAVGHIKRSVQTGAELPLQDALAFERELQSLLFKSEDAKEGLAAYNEKRVASSRNKISSRIQEEDTRHNPRRSGAAKTLREISTVITNLP